MYYFDHNATAPLWPEALAALTRAAETAWGNPSSLHAAGRAARQTVAEAREAFAALIAAQPAEIVFTGGGTEACHLGLLGLARASTARGRHLIVSAIEHPAVRGAAKMLEREGWVCDWVSPDGEGVVAAESVASMLRPDTAICAVMAANNETGALQPVAEIGALLHGRGVTFFVDATQALGKIPVRISDWSADAAAFAAHKIGGPKGVGALFLRKGADLEPQMTGGAQERGRRGGTENTPGIAGFGAAAQWWREQGEAERTRLRTLRDALEQALRQRVDDVRVQAENAPRLPNTLQIAFAGCRSDVLVMALDLRGIAVSAGSACASGSVKPSAVLLAMGKSAEEASSSLRFSLGRGNTSEETPPVVEAVAQAVQASRGVR